MILGLSLASLGLHLYWFKGWFTKYFLKIDPKQEKPKQEKPNQEPKIKKIKIKKKMNLK